MKLQYCKLYQKADNKGFHTDLNEIFIGINYGHFFQLVWYTLFNQLLLSPKYHSVWFKAQGEKEAEYFFPEEIFERTFNKPGDYPYVCEPHEESHDMKGIVHVVK